MSDLLITPLDEQYVRLDTNEGIEEEIADHFTFFVDGYKFMPSYKAGWFDGKIRMFNRGTKRFPKGLLPTLSKWCKDRGYTASIDNMKSLMPKVKVEAGWLEANWKRFARFEPMEHQVNAFYEILRRNQLFVKSATASGKSYIAYLVIRYLQENYPDLRVLMTVPTTSLVEQFYKDCNDYSADGWTSEENILGIYSGKEKQGDQFVTCSTWQSIYKLPRKWFAKFGAYICDEAHGANAKSLSAIIDNLPNSPIRVGMSGTLKNSKLHEFEMLARFGPIVNIADTAMLTERGLVTPLEIVCYRLKYTKDEAKYIKGVEYDTESKFIATHQRRNELIKNVCVEQEGNTLVLFRFVDLQGKALFNSIERAVEGTEKTVFYIDGSTKVDRREEIREYVEHNDNCILVASFQVYSTGINIKNLFNVIFAHPYKAKIKILQSIGRTLRLHKNKKKALLIDFGDDLCYTTKSKAGKFNTLYQHFVERLKIYSDEGFDYTIKDIDL